MFLCSTALVKGFRKMSNRESFQVLHLIRDGFCMLLHLLSSLIVLRFLIYKILVLPLIAVDMIAVSCKSAQES